MTTPYDAATDAAARLAELTRAPRHDVALVLGSGWLPAAEMLGEAVAETKAAGWCDRQVKFDPDLWIVEIEDRHGRAFVDEPIV